MVKFVLTELKDKFAKWEEHVGRNGNRNKTKYRSVGISRANQMIKLLLSFPLLLDLIKQNRPPIGTQDPREEKKDPDKIREARLWRTATAVLALALASAGSLVLSCGSNCCLSQSATSSREGLPTAARARLLRAIIRSVPLFASCKLFRRTACFKL